MKLGMFMMPVHPLHRDHTETLKEDREAVIFADQLGYHDVFIGEHLTDQAENITNSLLFLATLIHSTKNIRLASGTSSQPAMNMPHSATRPGPAGTSHNTIVIGCQNAINKTVTTHDASK